MVARRYQHDLDEIVARRFENGGQFWETGDGRWGVGSPFSTFDVGLILHELGLARSDPLLRGVADVLLASWQEDGRITPGPGVSGYPCHTANAARVLCRLGYSRDRRLLKTFDHLLGSQHEDGGWRCARVRLGKGRETDASNPGVTLAVLDALRFLPDRESTGELDGAVENLLAHWETRLPLGPCAFGIGSLFSKVEYPFLRYNLFYYLYVLSFYESAQRDSRFLEALERLDEQTEGGKVIVANPNRKLARFEFCSKGNPSDRATRRYRELRSNLVAN